MDQHILRFVAALRTAGVRVSPPEAADALVAAGSVDMDDRDAFRAALRGTLVKRDLDQDVFDDLFALHFSPFGSHDGDVPPAPARQLPDLPPQAVDALGAELQDLLDRLLEATDLELAMLVRDAGRDAVEAMTSLLQQGMVSRSILEALGVGGGADAALDRFQRSLVESGMSDDDARSWREVMRDQLERLRATVRGHVRLEFERLDAARRAERRRTEMRRAALGVVPPREAAEMARLVELLGRKLDSLPELRRRPTHRGALDMQRTQRANLSSGGVPFRLRWRRPPQRRPQIVALCDISNSMQSTVRFMLHFLYRLHDRFSRVRTFAFVSDVTEVTSEFDESSVDTAIEHALQPPGIAYYSSTNYGRALLRFLERYPDAVGTRTMVIVLGDARGNHTPPRAEVLEEVRRRARRLIWFNPEPRLSWGLGDSSMLDYLPHCSDAHEVRTLAQLEQAVDSLTRTVSG